MNKQKGLVLKKEDKTCFVMTPDGEFKHISLPEEIREGEEISLSSKVTGLKQMFMLAACICLAVFGWLAYQITFAQAAAYISLDFNPSLELGLDEKKKIVSVIPYDQPAEKLLQDLNIKRQPFTKGVKAILEKAIAEGYLKPALSQTILVAVAPVKSNVAMVITVQEAAQTINSTLKTKTGAKVIVTTATVKDHQEARKMGLSLGRCLLIKAYEKEGKTISIKELKEEKLKEIETRHDLTLEKVFLKQVKDKKATIILPLPEKPGLGEKLPQPAKPYLKIKEDNLKTDLPEDLSKAKGGLVPERHLPLKQKKEILLPPRQKRAMPDNKAAKQEKDAKEILLPEIPGTDIPKVLLPEVPKSKETKETKVEKAVYPLLPEILPQKEEKISAPQQNQALPEEGNKTKGDEIIPQPLLPKP